MATIGFIGLGNMGAPMAANLIKAGHRVTGFDVVPSAVEALAAKGARAAASGAEAAGAGEIVITMLPAGAQVRSVYLGEGGVLANAGNGTLLIDCSTSRPREPSPLPLPAPGSRCSTRRSPAALRGPRPPA
jgi:3-hydroxyisobutyrate dehydrogenase